MNKERFRYALLKEIENNTPLTEDDFGVDAETFDNNVWFLVREGYIDGVGRGDDRAWVEEDTYLTEKGEKYLKDNSSLSKLYKGLKEIKSWII